MNQFNKTKPDIQINNNFLGHGTLGTCRAPLKGSRMGQTLTRTPPVLVNKDHQKFTLGYHFHFIDNMSKIGLVQMTTFLASTDRPEWPDHRTPKLCDYFVNIHVHHKICGIRDASVMA